MKCNCIFFSPTGGTEKVVNILIGGIDESILKINLLNKDIDYSKIHINTDDLSIIAVPSFGGRVPSLAASKIKNLQGNNSRAIIVCTYGNRDFDDTLIELYDICKLSDFKVVGGITAIAEHSIINEIAKGRPDTLDYKNLKNAIEELINKEDEIVNIPGKRPYKPTSKVPMVPHPTKSCIKCGTCSIECPVEAIDKTSMKADSKKCISCMRCISVCKYGARKNNALLLKLVSSKLKKICSVRKEVEIIK